MALSVKKDRSAGRVRNKFHRTFFFTNFNYPLHQALVVLVHTTISDSFRLATRNARKILKS